MDLTDELLSLATRHEEELESLFWASEQDRWLELVFCVLDAFDDDPMRCRALVVSLHLAGVLTPEALARAVKPGADANVVLRHILAHHGIAADQAERLADALARIGQAVEERWQGKIQRYLRSQGAAMRDELLGIFGSGDGDEPQMRHAITHWLQNAAGIPLPLDDANVQRFRAERKIDEQALVDAADEVDFNVALLEDVIRAESEAAESAGEESS